MYFAKNALNMKQIEVTTEVRPVLPPAPIPAADSTYVVVFDVPNIAPIDVAVASANNALSIFDEKPGLFSKAFVSSSENIPVLIPVPIKVPIVSNVSDIENANIVISTNGNFVWSVNNEGSPSLVNITPNVCGSSDKASLKPIVFAVVVTPKGIPIRAVNIIPIKILPLTFNKCSITVTNNPIKNTYKPELLIVDKAGTPDSKLISQTFQKPK